MSCAGAIRVTQILRAPPTCETNGQLAPRFRPPIHPQTRRQRRLNPSAETRMEIAAYSDNNRKRSVDVQEMSMLAKVMR